MKNIFKSIIALAGLSILLTSCGKDSPEREASPLQDPNCLHVYIDQRGSATPTAIQLDPLATSTADFKTTVTLSRLVTEGAAEVPVRIMANTDNIYGQTVDGTWTQFGERIMVPFSDGQETSSFEVTFPNAIFGKNSYFDLLIDDPAFNDPYTKYSNGAAGLRIRTAVLDWEAYTGDIIMQDILGMNTRWPDFFTQDTTAWYVTGTKQVATAILTGGTWYRFANVFKTNNIGTEVVPDSDDIYPYFPYNTAATQLDGDRDLLLKMPGNIGITIDEAGTGMKLLPDTEAPETTFGSLYNLSFGYPRGRVTSGHINFPAEALFFRNASAQQVQVIASAGTDGKTRVFFDLETYKVVRQEDINNQETEEPVEPVEP